MIYDTGKASLIVQQTLCLLVCNALLLLSNVKSSRWNYKFYIIRFLHHVLLLCYNRKNAQNTYKGIRNILCIHITRVGKFRVF